MGGLAGVFYGVQLLSSIARDRRDYRDTMAAGLATGVVFGVARAHTRSPLLHNQDIASLRSCCKGFIVRSVQLLFPFGCPPPLEVAGTSQGPCLVQSSNVDRRLIYSLVLISLQLGCSAAEAVFFAFFKCR